MLKTTHRGVSLVELMVAIAVGLLIVLGTTTFFLTSQASVLENTESLKLNGIMRSSLDFRGRDISRTGYWESAPHFIGSIDRSSNPPQPDFAQINPFGTLALQHFSAGAASDCQHTTATSTSTASCNCLLFAYDHPGVSADSGELVQTVASGELSGYRLNGGQIEYKRSGTAFSCTEGEWSALTPSLLHVTQLEFELTSQLPVTIAGSDGSASVGNISKRSVTVRLGATLAGQTGASKTISDSFDIRNDHLSN